MRSSALYQAPFSFVLASFLCGVAAIRDVRDEDDELTVTSDPEMAPAAVPPVVPQALPPNPCEVAGAVSGDDHGPVCSCPPNHAALDANGLPCFDIVETSWRPGEGHGVDLSGCSCQEMSCILKVYSVVFGPLTLEQATFPSGLPGLEYADFECLLSEGGPAYENMKPVQSAGITEQEMWTYRDVVVIKDIAFQERTEVWTAGDIHGRLGSLRKLQKDWLERERTPYIVDLGDMIDRGNRQLEVIAGMIAWRALYPHKVSIVRGNHESIDIASQYGFMCVDFQVPNYRPPELLASRTEGEEKTTKKTNFPLFEHFARFFNLFPAALRIRHLTNPSANAVYMHGGFGPSVLTKLVQQGRLQKAKVSEDELIEILWSERGEECTKGCGKLFKDEKIKEDIEDIDSMFLFNHDRRSGFYRTNGATKQFLQLMESCMILTGHSHLNALNLILPSPEESGRCSGLVIGPEEVLAVAESVGIPVSGMYIAAVHLLANNFYYHSELADDPSKVQEVIGQVGSLVHTGDRVQFDFRQLFSDGSYDPVSQMLDVGVPGGQYPILKKTKPKEPEGKETFKCAYFAPDPSGYKCIPDAKGCTPKGHT